METITIENGKVFLTLPESNYKKSRFIGNIDFSEKIYQTKRKHNHVLRLHNGLGFCHKLINEINSFDFICVNYENRKIWTSRKMLLSKNLVHEFSKGKLEKQIFLPLPYFKNSRYDAEIELKKFEVDENKPIRKEVTRIKKETQMNLFSGVV